MAASLSLTSLLCNSLSFLYLSKPHLYNSFSSSQFLPQTHNPKHGFVPLVASINSNESTSMAVSTSISPFSTIATVSSDILQVVNPAMAYANTMFFKSAYNIQVIVEENEHEERLVGRFRREVMKAGIIQESKRRRFFENKQDKAKRKSREAAKRNRKRRPWKPLAQSKEESDAAMKKKKKDDDEEDNWDLPEGGLK